MRLDDGWSNTLPMYIHEYNYLSNNSNSPAVLVNKSHVLQRYRATPANMHLIWTPWPLEKARWPLGIRRATENSLRGASFLVGSGQSSEVIRSFKMRDNRLWSFYLIVYHLRQRPIKASWVYQVVCFALFIVFGEGKAETCMLGLKPSSGDGVKAIERKLVMKLGKCYPVSIQMFLRK